MNPIYFQTQNHYKDHDEMDLKKSLKYRIIHKVSGSNVESIEDAITVEEPIEISLEFGPANKRKIKNLAITMRTPGDDFNLVKGFLFSEAIISKSEDLLSVQYHSKDENSENYVLAKLNPQLNIDIKNLERHFYTSSSCGVCGKSSMEMVQAQSLFLYPKNKVSWSVKSLQNLANQLNVDQKIFRYTGGIHATGLFDIEGKIIEIKEDVGRHNAMDKMIGHLLDAKSIPLHSNGLLLSGRISFELVQKAWMIACPLLAGIGAPSSLAIELAEETGMTLIGFLKDSGFNIYAHPERIIL